MMYFQKLLVWQKAFDLSYVVHQLLKTFPIEERFALTDQMRRSSLSIVSNIAEGNGRAGPGEYAQFLSIAKGSCSELAAQMLLAQRCAYISEKEKLEHLSTIEEISKMLHAMIQKYRK